ncbi:MAG: hypothetical protein KJ749_14250, partial [Planctomycetes bacterium]|nr:hypothetical protein [Planctomycetota bacterium]
IINSLGGRSLAHEDGVEPLMQILEINGTPIETYDDFVGYNRTLPNTTVEIKTFFKGEIRNYTTLSGVFLAAVGDNKTAAGKAGLESGMIIESINGTVVKGYNDFGDIMDNTKPHQVINGTFLKRTAFNSSGWGKKNDSLEFRRVVINNITLGDKYEYYKDQGIPAWSYDRIL